MRADDPRYNGNVRNALTPSAYEDRWSRTEFAKGATADKAVRAGLMASLLVRIVNGAAAIKRSRTP